MSEDLHFSSLTQLEKKWQENTWERSGKQKSKTHMHTHTHSDNPVKLFRQG